jgi:hypothetical protein
MFWIWLGHWCESGLVAQNPSGAVISNLLGKGLGERHPSAVHSSSTNKGLLVCFCHSVSIQLLLLLCFTSSGSLEISVINCLSAIGR